MAKRVPPLTAIKLARLKPDRLQTIELIDGAIPGLRVRMSPTGILSWSLNIRDAKGDHADSCRYSHRNTSVYADAGNAISTIPGSDELGRRPRGYNRDRRPRSRS